MSEILSITEKKPIAAIATPIGEGGIAVIRVSGRGAIAKVQECFKGKDLGALPSHTIHFGRILDLKCSRQSGKKLVGQHFQKRKIY